MKWAADGFWWHGGCDGKIEIGNLRKWLSGRDCGGGLEKGPLPEYELVGIAHAGETGALSERAG